MRCSLALAIVVLVAGCADREREARPATLGDLAYAVPDGWTMKDVSERRSTIVVWTPPSNPGKQSITLVRTPAVPALANAADDRLAALLAAAQASVPAGSFLPPRRITTRHGITGVRVDGQFTPRGGATYRRTHLVVVDGDSLINILYTASTPDPEVLDLVLGHLARKAA